MSSLHVGRLNAARLSLKLIPIICFFSWQQVIDYIDSKFEDYLNAESRVNRRQMPDNRVHGCLYFIAPSGHGYVLLSSFCPQTPRSADQSVDHLKVGQKCDTMKNVLFTYLLHSKMIQSYLFTFLMQR